jgi:hypothetical protein
VIASDLGFDSLMASLSAVGAASLLPLPGVDEPTSAPDYMCRALALLRDREVPFESAWSSAINRIQAPQGSGGAVEDPAMRSLVLEERQLLEEARPIWRAVYEGRPVLDADRHDHGRAALRRIAPAVSAAFDRLDARSPAPLGFGAPARKQAA